MMSEQALVVVAGKVVWAADLLCRYHLMLAILETLGEKPCVDHVPLERQALASSVCSLGTRFFSRPNTYHENASSRS